MKAKRVWSAVLCAGLALSMCVNAGAAAQNDELRAAASYVSEQGVMVGDQNGDMALDQTLSRTELAVILTRITVNPEHLEAERELYTRKCEFPDVPEWASLYVGYLSFNGLMVGYDDGSFGAADLVTPAAACTVILRHLGYPESSGWSPNIRTISACLSMEISSFPPRTSTGTMRPWCIYPCQRLKAAGMSWCWEEGTAWL